MRASRRRLAAAAVAALLAAALLAAWFALRPLQALRQSLGPQLRIAAVQAGFGAIEFRDLVIVAAAGSGWPAADELRAARVVVTPDLSSLWPGRPWRLHGIVVEGGHLVLQRGADGRLALLPSLRRALGDTALVIGEIVLRDGSVDVVDASIAAPAHRLRLAGVRAVAGPLALPALDRMIHLDAQARLAGGHREGTIDLAGTLSVPLRDGKLQARIDGADAALLQPYLGRGSIAPPATLDLELVATLDLGELTAPVRLTLHGASRDAGRGERRFVLKGRLDDPSFSLNEALAARAGAGPAEAPAPGR